MTTDVWKPDESPQRTPATPSEENGYLAPHGRSLGRSGASTPRTWLSDHGNSLFKIRQCAGGDECSQRRSDLDKEVTDEVIQFALGGWGEEETSSNAPNIEDKILSRLRRPLLNFAPNLAVTASMTTTGCFVISPAPTMLPR